MQAVHIIEALVLHVLWSSTHDIRHCGISVLQPRHQPLGTAVTLKGIASQIPAEEEYRMSLQRNKVEKLEGIVEEEENEEEKDNHRTQDKFLTQFMKKKTEDTALFSQHL